MLNSITINSGLLQLNLSDYKSNMVQQIHEISTIATRFICQLITTNRGCFKKVI